LKVENKMSEALFAFNRSIGINHSGLSTKAKFTATVVAAILARHLPIPSDRVSVKEDYYNINCVPIVNEVLSALNEKLLVDLPICVAYTRNFWLVRMAAAFPEELITLNNCYGMIDTYVGAGNVWSAADHAFINEVKDGVLGCSVKAKAYLVELFPQYFQI